jgi:hypothetical protein
MTSSPSETLLMASARAACDGDTDAVFHGLITADLDWDDLLRCASAEGMGGMLYAQMTSPGRTAALPASAHQRLRQLFLHNELDYQVKLAAIGQLLTACDQTQIRVMLLQGVALIERIYPTAGMRPLSDIDLLIRPDDFEKIGRLLATLGYVTVSRYPPVYVRDGVRLDLHTQLAYLSRVEPSFHPLRLHDEPLWTAALPWNEGTTTAVIPSPTDHLILLCAHLQKHSFSRLIWFVDIGKLLAQTLPNTPLASLHERAALFHIEKPLYFVLSYLRDVLGLSVLRAVPSLAPPPLNRVERTLLRLLLADRRLDGMGDLLYLQAIGRPIAQARFLIQIAFPHHQVIQEGKHVPSAWRTAVGYLLRLCHLSWLAVRLVIGLIGGLIGCLFRGERGRRPSG